MHLYFAIPNDHNEYLLEPKTFLYREPVHPNWILHVELKLSFSSEPNIIINKRDSCSKNGQLITVNHIVFGSEKTRENIVSSG